MVKDSGDVCDENPSQTAFKWICLSLFLQASMPTTPKGIWTWEQINNLQTTHPTIEQWECFFNQGSPEWHRTEREDSHHISSLLSVLSLSACSLTTFSISWVADQFHLVLSGVREGLFPSIISESWLCVCCLFSGLVSPGWRPVCLSSSTNLPKLPFNALLSNTENNWWWIPQTIYTLWGDGLYFLLVLSLPSDSWRNDR